MVAAAQRLAVRVRRRERLGPMLVVSVALHLTALLSLLFIPSTPPLLGASAPPSVEVMADVGTPEGVKLPTPTDAPATPTEALPTTPMPPTPDVPPPTPEPQAQLPPAPAPPPPPPPDQSEVAALEPPPPPPPPPVEPPPPAAATPPPPVAAQPKPVRTVPPSRAKSPGPKAVSSLGAPPHSTDGIDSSSRVDGANQRINWYGKLNELAAQRVSYPKEASVTDQGGVVRVHMVISPDGWIKSVEVVHGSGSDVLDKAALAVFRDAHLQPFPPGTPAPPGDLEYTVHYLPARGGG